MNAMKDELTNLDATAMAALVAAGEVTALELVDAAIARVEARNPALNAVVAERFDAARDEAREGSHDGPLAGLPYLIKDLGTDVEGMVTSNGSRLFADAVAAADSELVVRLRRAGAIVVGKTNTPELGKSPGTEPALFGPSHNPWDLGRSPGGSSGGAAAAVAGGMLPAAHASDGGGSIRIPASACGLVGLKPTRGRVPGETSRGSAPYPMGVNHAVTRTVRDSAALLDAVAGPTPGMFRLARPDHPFTDDVGADPGILRIAVSTTSPLGEAHADCVEATERAATLCAGLGHDVEEADPGWEPGYAALALRTYMGASTAYLIERRLEELGRDLADDDIEPFTRQGLEQLEEVTPVDVIRAEAAMSDAQREMSAFFESFDLALTPTLTRPPAELGYLDTADPVSFGARAGEFAILTAPYNVSGHPAISLPLHWNEEGLPIGVQFGGRYADESTLIRLAAQLEEAAPWRDRRPPAR